MNRRASRIGLYVGSVLVFGACAWLFHLLRLNESRAVLGARDRAVLRARADESAIDRARLHGEADAIRASLADFTRGAYRRHDETQRLLRQIADRLDRIERRLDAQRQP